MSDWFDEAWMVLCNFIRQVLVEGLELHGPLAALTDAVRDKPMHRYH
jgi:hypothetical protein